MSSAAAITVENLGKRYVLGHAPRPDTLRDSLADGARGMLRRLFGRRPAATREDFWALRDVSFSLPRGEVLGIIGRNGAGKSTLLKILSRITEPTAGRAVIRGRVASLLEVGTGFHPELSGRENIFLNGAILGMTRAEIVRKFDEIVAFAEVERFLDTPVKHYSSGMYVRLAFAVAAHLEPEILIVDEVLAVGDAAFQRKCLGKMQDVARDSGRTVLFVSHNAAAISALCTRALYLAAGRVAAEGPVAEVLGKYAGDVEAAGADAPALPREVLPGIFLQELVFNPTRPATFGPVRFALSLVAPRAARLRDLCLVLSTPTGLRVAIVDLRRTDGPHVLEPGVPLQLRGEIANLPLVEGRYLVGLHVATAAARADHDDLTALPVDPAPPSGAPRYASQYRGVVELPCRIDHPVP